jgi:hypothetical protein
VLAAPTTLVAVSPKPSLAERSSKALRKGLSWWRAPFWFLALFTGAKSFADNPIIGSEALNRAGLHVWRLRIAHALTRWRRKRLANKVPRKLREQFDRDGFVVVRDFLTHRNFAQLQETVLNTEFECRAQQQGDTITRRVAVGPEIQRCVPSLTRLLRSGRWCNLIAYAASTRSRPFYYIQTISGGVASGPEDPQVELHSDTFHPSLKAWLFLTDVGEDERPLTYVAGSHRLSAKRIAWEQRKSVDVMRGGDRLSQRGSFRIRPDELDDLGLPQPTRFCVPANTLVIADTCGFHARASAQRPTIRVELWAYCRRNPFLPWTGSALISWSSLAARRVEYVHKLVDWLDRRGLRKQHWQPAGRQRPIDV